MESAKALNMSGSAAFVFSIVLGAPDPPSAPVGRVRLRRIEPATSANSVNNRAETTPSTGPVLE